MASFFGLTIGRIQGNSMLPRIPPDSFFIASSWHLLFPSLFPIKEGQIYYINHDRYGFIVKTLNMSDDINKRYWFRGESPESVSTEAMGAVAAENIIGRVIWVIPSKK